MNNRNLLPSVQTQALLGLLQARRAREIAREHAAQGVPPEIAARHAVRSSAVTLFVWMYALPPAGFVLLFYQTATPGWLAWKTSVLAASFVLWNRQRRFAHTDPRLRLRYRIPTWLWVALLILLWVGGIVGALQAYTSSPWR